MKNINLFGVFFAALALAGCATGNSYLADRNSTVEMYHIFDVKTASPSEVVIKAAADGLAQNTGTISQTTPLQMGKAVPATPGRFTLEDLSAKFAGTGVGSLMQMAAMQNGGAAPKMANCEGAVWTSRAVRSIPGSSNLTLYSCLYKYQAGYQLNTYAVFQKTEGGLKQISRDIANSMVGTPEQWVNKTILDTVKSIEDATRVKATHVEGQPTLAALPTGRLVSQK